MSDMTVYHNPACGTSRNTLEMIRNSGTEPTIIYYLETPPTRDEAGQTHCRYGDFRNARCCVKRRAV